MVETAYNQSKFLQTTEIKEMIGKRGADSRYWHKLKHPFSLRSKSNRFATSFQNKPSWSCWIYIHASYNRKRFIILDKCDWYCCSLLFKIVFSTLNTVKQPIGMYILLLYENLALLGGAKWYAVLKRSCFPVTNNQTFKNSHQKLQSPDLASYTYELSIRYD